MTLKIVSEIVAVGQAKLDIGRNSVDVDHAAWTVGCATGSLNSKGARRRHMAHKMVASFLAIAVLAFLRPMRAASRIPQRLRAVSSLERRSAVAAMCSSQRSWALPCLVMPPRTVVWPEAYSDGTNPRYAATSRPLSNRCGSRAVKQLDVWVVLGDQFDLRIALVDPLGQFVDPT